jgi:hypothetical protein
MKMFTLTSLLGALALTLVAAAYPLATAVIKTGRIDCPGEVVCPLTGEEVCKDRCPLTTAKQTDPVEPADSAARGSEEEAGLPPCCLKNELTGKYK